MSSAAVRTRRIALFYLCISMHCPADFTRPITDFTWTQLYQSPSNFRCVYVNNTEKRSKSLLKKIRWWRRKNHVVMGCKASFFSSFRRTLKYKLVFLLPVNLTSGCIDWNNEFNCKEKNGLLKISWNYLWLVVNVNCYLISFFSEWTKCFLFSYLDASGEKIRLYEKRPSVLLTQVPFVINEFY